MKHLFHRRNNRNGFLSIFLVMIMLVGILGIVPGFASEGTDPTADPPPSSGTGDEADSVVSDPIDITEDEIITGIDEGVRTPESIFPLSVTSGDSSLTVKVGEVGSTTLVDVGALTPTANAITWPMTGGNRQIQITANFGPTGTPKDRTITVDIPRGYKIVEYSAKSGTPKLADVTQLVLSSTDDPKVASSLLTASNGSDWESQAITGYTAMNSPTEASYRVYNGKITYSFNNNCDQITLTLTLALDSSIMPHDKTTYKLDNLTVNMVSGKETLTDNLSTTVSELVLTTVGISATYPNRNIPGIEDGTHPEKGTVPEFITGYLLSPYTSDTGTQAHLAEKVKMVFDYPEGVSFAGFNASVLIGGGKESVDANTFTSDKYANDHLTVTLDKISNTVTFEFDKVIMRRITSEGQPVLLMYWTAVVDDINIQWNDTLEFNLTFNESSGAVVAGTTQAHEQVVLPGPKIKVMKPGVDIQIIPKNRTRRDLNAYVSGAYPYDYLLGGFEVQNLGPSVAGKLKYEFTFPDTLAVRGVSLPGMSGNDYSEVTAYTNLGRTITLTKAASQLPAVTNTAYTGVAVTIDSTLLGLADGEYLISLTALQDSLNVQNHVQYYTYSHTSYYGRFQGGEEGDVTLVISDVTNPTAPVQYANATDHTTIGWTNFGAGFADLTAKPVNPGEGEDSGSFYPGAGINFTATYEAGRSVNVSPHQNDGVDPVIYICLPTGIALDTSSVMAKSVSGNHGDTSFALTQVGSSSTVTINGDPWTKYTFTSPNTMDMVARSDNRFQTVLQPPGFNKIEVDFIANVSSACGTYSGLKPKDIVIWDFGKTAISATGGTSYVFADDNNIAGKGTGYIVVGARNQATNINIVQKPGLSVRIGIRTYESDSNTNPFFTYDGTSASIAPVTVNAPAEVWLEYENTDSTNYKVGSEIYLPIPKKNKEYDLYFNATESFPVSGGAAANRKIPEWTGSLTGSVSLPGFTTLYTTDAVYSTESLPQTDTWVPIDPPTGWIPQASMTSADYKNVTMIKFVASTDIVSTAHGETKFTIDVDSGAKLGEVNYWRSYQKGWRDLSGAGSWVYGSVIAAEPSMSGVEGMIFLDVNLDGEKAATGENFDPTASGKKITATLTEKYGGISPLDLTIDTDGSVKSLTTNGTQYFLKTGEYIITFTNSTSGAYAFTSDSKTPHVGEQTTSDGTNWYMDVQQLDIMSDQTSAKFEFIVDANTQTDMTMYVGVGVRNSWTVTYNPGAGAAFTQSNVSVLSGNNPTSIPDNIAANVQPGYDSNTMSWELDVDVTLSSGGGVKTAGTPLTLVEMGQVIVKSNIEATATFSPYNYTITYNGISGSSFDPTNPNPAMYKVTDTFPITITNPVSANLFNGWTVVYTNSSITDITTPEPNYSIPTGTTEAITLTANWSTTPTPSHNVTYIVDGDTPAIVSNMPTPATQSEYEGDTVTVATNPATTSTTNASGISGTWTFNGWTSIMVAIPGGAGNTFTMPANNVTITGSWAFTPTPPIPPTSTITPPPPTPTPTPTPTPSPTPTPPVVVVPDPGPNPSPDPGPNPTPDPVPNTTPNHDPVPEQSESRTREIAPTPAEVLETIKEAGIPTMPIGGTEMPLSAAQNMQKYVWALLNLILAIVGLILVIITAIRIFKKKNDEIDEYKPASYDDECSEEEKRKRRVPWIALAIIMGIAGIIVFFLTEDMRNLMVFIDNWTIANAIIFVLGVLGYVFAFKRTKEEKPDYDKAVVHNPIAQ